LAVLTAHRSRIESQLVDLRQPSEIRTHEKKLALLKASRHSIGDPSWPARPQEKTNRHRETTAFDVKPCAACTPRGHLHFCLQPYHLTWDFVLTLLKEHMTDLPGLGLQRGDDNAPARVVREFAQSEQPAATASTINFPWTCGKNGCFGACSGTHRQRGIRRCKAWGYLAHMIAMKKSAAPVRRWD
jgi:hypothetical protein